MALHKKIQVVPSQGLTLYDRENPYRLHINNINIGLSKEEVEKIIVVLREALKIPVEFSDFSMGYRKELRFK